MSTNNTYFTLAGLKTSPVAEGTAFLVQDPALEDGAFFWTPGNFTGQADDRNIIESDSTALNIGAWVRQGDENISLSQGGNLADAIHYVTPLMFGAIGDGVADDTEAFQEAQDSGLPVEWPIPEVAYRLTDTILLEPGAIIRGAGGAANYDASPVKIHFEPASKRDLFNWRTPRTDAPYEYGGCQISGFCVRGFGAGIDACVDLPLLYNGRINFFAYAGVDTWMRIRRWMDTVVEGGVQGFGVAGVDFAKAGSIGDPHSDVTTTTTINAYVSGGPVAYRAADRSVTDCKISGAIESVDNACNCARGNVMHFDVYTENVPRTDSGSAWVYGKAGISPAYETALHLSLRPGIGHSGGTLDNANLVDVDHVRLVKVSGYSYLYKTFLKTTANTQKVVISGLDTDNIEAFSPPDGIADYSRIAAFGFTPRFMTQLPGGPSYIDGMALFPELGFFEVSRDKILPGKMFADATLNGKIIRRDEFGNFSAPIGALRVTGQSGWTVQGGRLTPGELVQNTSVLAGAPAFFISARFTKDTANNYSGCSTTSGSPVVTNATIGTFFLCEVGDYVTVNAGFGDPVLQRQVIARSPDLTSITLDSNATSTVSGMVGVSTEAHKLLEGPQQGHRRVTGDPVGAVASISEREEIFRTDTNNWYKATGPTITDWKLLT